MSASAPSPPIHPDAAEGSGVRTAEAQRAAWGVTLLQLEVWKLRGLDDNWDGQGARAPSELACEIAHRLLDEAIRQGMPPDRVVPDVTGGVALYWFGAEQMEGGAHRRYASIGVENYGDVALLMVERDKSIASRDLSGMGDVEWAIELLSEFVGSHSASG